jgi:hypothetical protein
VALFALVAGAARTADPVGAEYLARSYPEADGRNVVNVILVDFRGLDTMGEIVVLLVAALGIITLVMASRVDRAAGAGAGPGAGPGGRAGAGAGGGPRKDRTDAARATPTERVLDAPGADRGGQA